MKVCFTGGTITGQNNKFQGLIEEPKTNCSKAGLPLQQRLELSPGYKMRDYVKIQFHCLSYELEKENILC